jgi:predicted TIM-barrel fold metal-dependent hydrolase
MARPDYRPYLPSPAQSKIMGPTARAHAKARTDTPRGRENAALRRALVEQPFAGITADGTVMPGLFSLRPDGAPVAAMTAAAAAFFGMLAPAQRAGVCFAVDDNHWRRWQNSELYVEDFGLRLEEAPDALRDAAMAVVRASLSAQGFAKSRDVMRLNRFIGDLLGAPHVLGEWSYLFSLFGVPGAGEPWGWQLFGHHLCLHCLVVAEQMVLTPSFMGAEPSYADTGPFAGISLFEDEERSGLALMRALGPHQQRQAIVAHAMMGGDLPPGRRHPNDNLHLAGAYQDNRIIPCEGIAAHNFSADQRRALVDLIACYVEVLPPGPQQVRMAEIERHLPATHFCWIGGFDEASPFYYRIQSPVVLIEFDHHAGVFLTNAEPAKFHVHTIVRTPNGNDYGRDLLRLHYEQAPHQALANDRLAEASRKYPDRITGLAAFAPRDPARAARELERAVRTLGLKGGIVNSHSLGEYLDDRKFWPIFEAVQAMGVPIYIHPRDPSPQMIKPFEVFGFKIGWSWAAEVGTHIVRLIGAGVFDQFPRLQIVIGHMGEGLPFHLDRIDNRYFWEHEMAGTAPKLKRKPSGYVRDNVVLTTSGMNYSPPLLLTIQMVGIDNVLFAADYPFENVRESVAAIDGLAIADRDKEKLYHLNAKRVFAL